MALIASISGIRGTIGGAPGSGLTPPDIVRFTAAYGKLVLSRKTVGKPLVVVGRDGRISGPMVEYMVLGTLAGMGIDTVHLGLASTPTVELAVPHFRAQGGIIITASHNPMEWNALKLLNEAGEFITDKEGKEIMHIAGSVTVEYARVNDIGSVTTVNDFDDTHIGRILDLDLVSTEAIQEAGFTVVVDGINSVGGIIVPRLLHKLGVKNVVCINAEPDGYFAHPPEPLPDHLTDICEKVKAERADLGIVVDPDVDRLALVDEKGKLFGEEYTLVAVADYVLMHRPGNTVSNLSSSRALRDITVQYGGKYAASAVGEVNVVQKMKETGAVIGGEGNGGVIYPVLHYGRDALAGIALFLSHLAKSGETCSALRARYPDYYLIKEKAVLGDEVEPEKLFSKLENHFAGESLNREDGLRIDFDHAWVHLRLSNTEPIVRIYAEADDRTEALSRVEEIMRLTGLKRKNS
ncbi:MAG: phosphoglucosamine mutase [Bacteroidales bacterium]